jgi:hypothetical protein
MQAASVLRPAVRADRRLRLSWPSDAAALFGLSLASYLAVAAVLVFGYQLVAPETLSRVGNAYYTIYSRDPHLAAIGFVWKPLPSLLVLPLLPLKTFWPALTELGVAGIIVSAAFMAGAVYQLYALLVDLDVARPMRLGLTILFALHPLLLFAAASGMSESILLFFLLLAVRSLSGWLRTAAMSTLVTAGAALGAAYLTRDEGLFAGVGAILVVGGVSLARTRGSDRWRIALADALILAAPIGLAMACWTAMTWLITGDPLQQLSSIYGTSSQIHALQAQGADVANEGSRIMRGLHRLLALEPGVLAVSVLALLGLGRKGMHGLAAVALLAPVLAALFIGCVLGWTLPGLRYFIVVVPLAGILAGIALSQASRSPLRVAWPRMHAVVALAALTLALPTGLLAMSSPALGGEESAVFRAVFNRGAINSGEEPTMVSSRSVAQYLDQLLLPEGSVLVDSFTGFSVVLASRNPHQFVITSDRDFLTALGSPAEYGVLYVLVPSPRYLDSLSSLDAVNRAYPDLYRSGASIAVLDRQFDNAARQPDWRLYRLLAPTSR